MEIKKEGNVNEIQLLDWEQELLDMVDLDARIIDTTADENIAAGDDI